MKTAKTAAIALCLLAGIMPATANTSGKKIAFSNNYAGNSWRQAMLKSYGIVAKKAVADHVIAASRGRGAPMNTAAALGSGGALLFLHADTALPDDADRLIDAALSQRAWGRFDLRIAGRHPLLAIVARMINWRSRLTGVASGDQAIFVRRDVFLAVGFCRVRRQSRVVLAHACRS